MIRYSVLLVSLLLLWSCQESSNEKSSDPESDLALSPIPGSKPKNVIFILSDDHRYDFMGFTGKVPWLKTPHMDRMASEGAYFNNAFVSTSLCSPSRASILTGLYPHSHTVVDNSAPVPDDLIFFPQYLQEAGYQTGFFGKWHMGHGSSDPRPGFDHWVSFRGQGNYYNPELNINGKAVKYEDSTYVTDLLTEHAVSWLEERDPKKPFFLYLSHKAVHALFRPAKRHAGMYANEDLVYPPTYDQTATDEYKELGWPEWVKAQRNSWHGVDDMYHGEHDFDSFFKNYCETLAALDESVGVMLDYAKQEELANNTVVIYMGDNGFSFGEHGLIDKRQFYEESAKVPFLWWEKGVDAGQTNNKMIQNIDIAPTILELAGLEAPDYMHGISIIPTLSGEEIAWRDKIFYEYYWEYYYPQTPTVHAVRTVKYKYMQYHGIWDSNELYDLENDPNEIHNLIKSPDHQEIIGQLREDIYDWLESTNGTQIPIKRLIGKKRDNRYKGLY